MTCCNQDCDQGRDCPTTRTYPRTLREAFPHAPEPTFDEEMVSWGWFLFSYVIIFAVGFVASLLLDKAS